MTDAKNTKNNAKNDKKADDSQADEAQKILSQMEAKKNDDECAFC